MDQIVDTTAQKLEVLQAKSDSEISKLIFDILGWAVVEVKDSIVERDENGDEIYTEISLYNLKSPDGKTYYRGSPFIEDIYRDVNVSTFHFLPIMIKFITDHGMSVTTFFSGSNNSAVIKNDDSFIEVSYPEISKFPRAFSEAFILSVK